MKDKGGNQLAPKLEQFIKQNADKIDYETAFKEIFYGVNYTDYLFSLPMGAGKTYLMAAFIYLDLYFAQNEPDNPAFAHNFMVMAPSGLKSSIVPSLKHIKEFDPSWIIPESKAAPLRKLIKFEILDEQKTANKSNRVKNPNAQKINNHQPLSDLMGLVAITNAEKVILDHYEVSLMPLFVSQQELYKIERANELREIIGKIPHLAIYIDEVHHAADGDIKLRQVINDEWAKSCTFNSVLGFSATPYLDKAVYQSKQWEDYEGRFIPQKRIALDGKIWWCVYDMKRKSFSTYTCHGKYTTKTNCQLAIDFSINHLNSFFT